MPRTDRGGPTWQRSSNFDVRPEEPPLLNLVGLWVLGVGIAAVVWIGWSIWPFVIVGKSLCARGALH
jgi:hypothetical protein